MANARISLDSLTIAQAFETAERRSALKPVQAAGKASGLSALVNFMGRLPAQGETVTEYGLAVYQVACAQLATPKSETESETATVRAQ